MPQQSPVGRDQHNWVSQGACWFKQQVSPVWKCQSKPCSGSASVLWLELPVTKPQSWGVKCGNSPVRLKSCQCRATIGGGECFSGTAVYFHPLWKISRYIVTLNKILHCTVKVFRRLGEYACSAVCGGTGL